MEKEDKEFLKNFSLVSIVIVLIISLFSDDYFLELLIEFALNNDNIKLEIISLIVIYWMPFNNEKKRSDMIVVIYVYMVSNIVVIACLDFEITNIILMPFYRMNTYIPGLLLSFTENTTINDNLFITGITYMFNGKTYSTIFVAECLMLNILITIILLAYHSQKFTNIINIIGCWLIIRFIRVMFIAISFIVLITSYIDFDFS